MDTLSSLRALGLELPSPAYIMGAIFFGLAGLVAYRRGRRSDRAPTRWLGVALMLYPYGVSKTALLYAVGVALCVAVVVVEFRQSDGPA